MYTRNEGRNRRSIARYGVAMPDAASLIPSRKIPPKLAQVPPFPAVAMKLLTLLTDEHAGFASIASCIATDPALAGRLLNRANAADVANYCEVRNVVQCLNALGMDRTREVCLTLVTAEYAAAALRTEVLLPCWHHTLATALIASELGRQCGFRPAEIYTAALLHDIGRLGLLSAFPREYAAMMKETADRPGSLIELERAHFGVDHVEAGGWLAREWKLPESLAQVIAHHQEPPEGSLSETAAVHMACRLADLLGFSADPTAEIADFDAIVATLPESVRTQMRAKLPLLRKAILKETGLSAETEASLTSAEQMTADRLANELATRREQGLQRWVVGALAGTAGLLLVILAFLFR